MAGKMLKFIRGKGQQPSAERQKLQQELFAFQKTLQHGFPNRASALAWDPQLRLMALGTASGALKVYGRPGVEFYGQHTEAESPVTQIHFIPGTGRLVSLCDDNSLHLWEINEKSLVELRTLTLDSKQKRVSALCVEAGGQNLLVGSENGNLYTLDMASFTLTDDVIYQDAVMNSCPDDYKKSPGAVEHVCEHPTQPSRLLIGYDRGLIVLWDRAAARPTHTFVSSQQLESLCWSDKAGDNFISSHNDGSHVSWEVSPSADAGRDKPLKEPVSPYGPYACKAITKILSRSAHNAEQITIFSGGMPRASYSDKYTVTVQQGEKHVAFDFTSRVIDFFTTTPAGNGVELPDERPLTPAQIQSQSVFQPASALVVLAEEELVVIDLCCERYKPLRPACLVSLHASAVTSTHIADRVTHQLYNDIRIAGLKQTEDVYSEAEWPITGGVVDGESEAEADPQFHQLLLTGHEDGSVRFWDIDGVVMTPLYKYTTSQLFSGEEIAEVEEGHADEEEWPPFRRVGSFDPYSDDPRLAVKKVTVCPLSGMLAVGGAAGHVVLASLVSGTQTDVKYVTVNLVSDRDGFVWKGHDPLTLRSSLTHTPTGYQACSVVQMVPPAAVTSLSVQCEWGLVSAGTAHGLILYDAVRCVPVYNKCTLLPGDSGAGDTPISRRKSFKKSLRESFRRLRKGRSQRHRQTTQPATTPTQVGARKTVTVTEATESAVDARPVERPVEARATDSEFGSMVRCLYFARTFLISSQNTHPTMWAGTNNGTVYAFTLTVPNTNRRKEDAVSCQLAKEIQLKHRAPVIGITILDGASVPLPEPLEVERGVSPLPDNAGPLRVLIASEEQFKIFTLPSLKPYCKYKLTAHEGSRVRRMGFAWFECDVEGGKHRECCLLCLTNLGDCLLLSVPELRRQLNAAAARKEDINGISSLSFSKQGEALYLHSSSELQRITLSATKVTSAHCHVPLAAWAAALRTPVEPAPQLHNGDLKEAEVTETTAHDVTAASGDITVDSVRDHTAAVTHIDTPLNINLQNSAVNTSSMVVKTTTRTATNDNSATETATTNVTTTTENILEHSREEGVITRIETGTVTVPAGTDPKLILEMFERARTPLAVPVPPPGATVVNHTDAAE